MFGYCNELFGENGIGWTERLRGVHEQIIKPGGDPAGVSAYWGRNRLPPEIGERATAASSVGLFAAPQRRLQEQKSRGSRFFIGDNLSAMDVLLGRS